MAKPMIVADTSEKVFCFTCRIVGEYIGLANEFTQNLSAALVGPMWALFSSMVVLWVIAQGIRMAAFQTTVADFGREFVFVIIAMFLLSGQGPDLVNTIYAAALKLSGSAASVALQVGNQQTSASPAPDQIGGGMQALVKAAETGVREVFGMAAEIAGSATLTRPLPIFYAIALILPYFLVLTVYFSQVVVSIFRVMMLAVISPYLMFGFAFGWGRGMAASGIRTLLSSFMILFGATAALSVLLYAVSGLHIGDPGYDPSAISITDSRYLLALAMGWLGTAFMTEATGIANSISGSVLSNTATGVITSGAVATAMTLIAGPKSIAARALTSGAGWAADKGSAAYTQRVADLVQLAKK